MKQKTVTALCVLFSLLTTYRLSISLGTGIKVLLQYERTHRFDSEVSVIDVRSKKQIWYPVPEFAKFKRFKFLRVSKRTYRVEVETYAPVPNGMKDTLSFTIFFKHNNEHHAIGVTCGLGPSPYRSTAPSRFSSLQGGVFSYLVEPGRPRWISPLRSAVIKGNKLTFDFPSKFVQNPKKLHRLVIRYLPHGFIPTMPWLPIVDGRDFESKGGKEVFYMTMEPPDNP